MRSMSLDVGTRTIGVAASDLMGMIANGVETIRRTSEERDLQRIGELIAEYEVDTMVVGYPKNMNGSVGERAQSCEDFARVIGERFPQLKIVLWDERLSTVAAEKNFDRCRPAPQQTQKSYRHDGGCGDSAKLSG